MLDIMLDLETMGLRPDSAIVSIGAVEFSIARETLGERFHQAIDLESCVNAGLVIDPSTVTWWLGQSDAARSSLLRNTKPLPTALADFTAWCCGRGPLNEIRVWGNGASFDNVVLASAYRAVGIEMPWRYWNDRCFRTACAMYPSIEKRKRAGTHHNALDDAIYQAEHLIYIKETQRARKGS